MSDIFYTLSWIFPYFQEFAGTVGTVLLIFGLVNAFFGYKLFETVLSIVGFLVGAVVGLGFFLQSGNFSDSETMWLYILGGGFLGSMLAGLFHSLGVFIAAGGMAAIVAFVATQDSQTACIVGVICGLIGAWAEKYAIIVTSALSGGSFVTAGLWLRAAVAGENRETGWLGWIIGIGGILFQLWMERRIPTQSGKEEKTERPARADLPADRQPPDFKLMALKSILALPAVIGIVLGNLFDSAFLGCGFAAAMYIPILVQLVRKCRAEARYGIPAPVRSDQERWVNEVLIDNLLLPLVLPGSFCILLYVMPGALDWGDFGTVFSMLLGLVIFVGGGFLTGRYLWKCRLRMAEPSQETRKKPPVPPVPAPKPGGGGKTPHVGVCPMCGFPLRASSVFCGGCGARVKEPARKGGKYCGQCGAKLSEGDTFCHQCGAAQAPK